MRSLRSTTKSSPCSVQLEKVHVQQQRPNAAKNKNKLKKKNLPEDEVLGAWEPIVLWDLPAGAQPGPHDKYGGKKFPPASGRRRGKGSILKYAWALCS